MADIRMCDNKGCKLNKLCYRFTAEPNPYRQPYFMGDVRNEDGSCDHFWDNSEYEKVKSN